MGIRILDRSEQELLRRQFVSKGFVVIPSFLDQDFAEILADDVARHKEWNVSFTGQDGSPHYVASGEWEALSECQRSRTIIDIYDRAAHSFQFYYKTFLLNAKHDPSGSGSAASFLGSAEFMRVLSETTGVAALSNIVSMISRFEAGHFLNCHSDRAPEDDPGHREFAFVLNLTRHWDRDWGAHTCLWTALGASRCIATSFNTLLIFSVPRPHSVSFVPPFVPEARLACVGWAYSGRRY